MSFSSETKKELCKSLLKHDELICAEAYGMLIFGRRFSVAEISCRTESTAAANRFTEIITERTGSVVEVQSSLTTRRNASHMYSISIPNPDDCKRVCVYFGHDAGEISLHINRANIENDRCAAAFLRGAFLICGNVSEPVSEYHLEFVVQHKNLSEDLCKLIAETTAFVGGRIISPKIIKRRGVYIVYLKDSEDISDLLTLMGAANASMAVMQAKIMKSYNNATNRKVNSQVANTDKAFTAAAKQLQAINILEESGVLKNLSDELKEVAQIRKEYPQATLKDLAEKLSKPMSKSGINHRLNKLIELSKDAQADSANGTAGERKS